MSSTMAGRDAGSWEMMVKNIRGQAFCVSKLSGDELQAALDKKDQMEHVVKNAELSKPEIIKVVREIVSEVGLMKKRYDNYAWSVTSRRKPEKSTDIHINPRCHHSNKKNQCVGDLMKSMSKKYKRLKGIAKTLESNESLTLPEQDPLLPSNRKRKAMGLEPETYIASLHCNHKLPEGVKFMNNKVIEKPKHGLFFIDVFGDPSF
ncbi:hypothetical protein Tco_0794844 [Tanacetum coccineum]